MTYDKSALLWENVTWMYLAYIVYKTGFANFTDMEWILPSDKVCGGQNYKLTMLGVGVIILRHDRSRGWGEGVALESSWGGGSNNCCLPPLLSTISGTALIIKQYILIAMKHLEYCRTHFTLILLKNLISHFIYLENVHFWTKKDFGVGEAFYLYNPIYKRYTPVFGLNWKLRCWGINWYIIYVYN